jgi:hypothetical protein
MVDKVIQDRMCRNTGGRMVVVYSVDQMSGQRLYYVMDFANDRWCSVTIRESANLLSSYPDFWQKKKLQSSSGVGVDTCPGYSILDDNVRPKISPQRPVRLIDGDVLLVEYRGEVYSVRAMNGQVGVTKMLTE